MFKLGTALAVFRDSSPFVWPEYVFVGALVDHGFDSEYMPNFHGARYLIVLVMRNRWFAVKDVANTMSTVGACYCKTSLIYVFADKIANISIEGTWFE